MAQPVTNASGCCYGGRFVASQKRAGEGGPGKRGRKALLLSPQIRGLENWRVAVKHVLPSRI